MNGILMKVCDYFETVWLRGNPFPTASGLAPVCSTNGAGLRMPGCSHTSYLIPHASCRGGAFRFTVLYNYHPHNQDELELTEGDTITVMEQCDDGWFVGGSERAS